MNPLTNVDFPTPVSPRRRMFARGVRELHADTSGDSWLSDSSEEYERDDELELDDDLLLVE